MTNIEQELLIPKQTDAPIDQNSQTLRYCSTHIQPFVPCSTLMQAMNIIFLYLADALFLLWLTWGLLYFTHQITKKLQAKRVYCKQFSTS